MGDRQRLQAHAKDIGGGFMVRRSLPAAQRQAVGPFLFFDHFGPVEFGAGEAFDVRPHPHIGLATVSYLFEGALLHRDSIGAVQRIEPGAINWMTAGRGIVHSERTPDELRGHARRLHGVQLWAALPEPDEAAAPRFEHTPAAAMPRIEAGGARVTVLVGTAFGATSPVAASSPTLLLDIELRAGAALALPPAAERAVYGVDAPFRVGDEAVPPRQMVVLDAGEAATLAADAPARVLLIGGEPLGHRFMWWNFVARDRARIEQAKDDWRAQRFAPVPGETDFIPLP